MIHNLLINKICWSVTTILTLFVAVYGIFNNKIYLGLMPKEFIAAQFSQDILTTLVCLVLFFLIYKTNNHSIKTPIIISGILGSIAYLYAIFSIERVYNEMYIFYLLILGASFYTLLFTIHSFDPKQLNKIVVSKLPRIASAIFSIIIGILFSLLWTSALLPLMKSHTQIDNLFSIYILDLSFVMPAYFITALLTFLKKPLGYVLTPAMDILGIFVIFPLGLGEVAKPLFHLTPNLQNMTMSFVLTGLFFLAAVWQLKTFKKRV